MWGKTLSNFFTSSGIVVFPLTGLGVIYVTENKVKIDTIIQSIKDGTFSLDSLKSLLISEPPEPPQPKATSDSGNPDGAGEDVAGTGTDSGDQNAVSQENSGPSPTVPAVPEAKPEAKPAKPEKPKKDKKKGKKEEKSIDLSELIDKLIKEWEEQSKTENDKTKKENLTKATDAMKKIKTFVDNISKQSTPP